MSGPPPSPRNSSGFVEIDRATTPALVTAMGDDGDRVRTRLMRGCRAFAVSHGDLIAAYGWLSAGPEWIGELDVSIEPAAGEAYVWNCVTLEPYRRLGMYRAVLVGIVARARSEGMTRLWIGSIEDPAEKADADAGFAPVLHLHVTRFGTIRRLEARPDASAPASLALEARNRLGLASWVSLARARARVH